MCSVDFTVKSKKRWGQVVKLKERVGEEEDPGRSVMTDAQNKERQQQKNTKMKEKPTKPRATSSGESNECEGRIEELLTRERNHEGKSERRRTRLRGCVCIPLY